MTLQERQQREVFSLKNEITDAFEMANYIKAVELIEVLITVKSDPEKYFQNIYKEG